MSYNLSIKVLGSIKKELVAKIDIPFHISDFVYIDGFGYIFLLPENDCLALYDIAGKKLIMPWIGQINKRGCRDGSYKSALLDKPASICNGKGSSNYYIIEQNANSIVNFAETNPFGSI
jgi:hypothetical protein